MEPWRHIGGTAFRVIVNGARGQCAALSMKTILEYAVNRSRNTLEHIAWLSPDGCSSKRMRVNELIDLLERNRLILKKPI